MKYINPGFPQLMDYQTLNILTVGKNTNKKVSNTEYFFDLSSNNDILFKTITPTKQSFILFDIVMSNDADDNKKINEWTKLFDIYNDNLIHYQTIKLCYKQYTNYKFLLAIFNDNDMISKPYYISTDELKTIELDIFLEDVTRIELYMNNVLQETILGEFIPYTEFNRFNFYGNYYADKTIAVSHLIYQDTKHVGNERIKMLNTDKSQSLITNNSSEQYIITDTLNEEIYSDIVSFGFITDIINNSNLDITVTENTYDTDYSFKSRARTEQYHNTNIELNPQTKTQFTAQDISNNVIKLTTKVDASNVVD